MFGLKTDLARECLYRFFSVAVTEPSDSNWVCVLNPENQRLAAASVDFLREAAEKTIESILPALTLEPLFDGLQQSIDILHDEYQRVFGLTPARECPPFEVEYHTNTEPFFQSQQLADVAGFYRAFGLNPSTARASRQDHLALELEFMAFLLMKQRQIRQTMKSDSDKTEKLAVCDQAATDFFREHIAWWVPAFATGLIRRSESGIYAELGKVLAAFFRAECMRLGIATARMPLAVVAPVQAEEPTECAACAAG